MAWPYSTFVLCRFTPDIHEAEQVELQPRVESSHNAIGRMRELRFARLVPAESNMGYQYLLPMVFENEADLDNYMGHPAHIELAEWAVARGCEFLYFDYDLESVTALRQPA